MTKRLMYWVLAGSLLVVYAPAYLSFDWHTYWISKTLTEVLIFVLCFFLWERTQFASRQTKYVHHLERQILAENLRDKAADIWHPNGRVMNFGDERHLFTVHDVIRRDEGTARPRVRSFFGVNERKGTLYITDQSIIFARDDEFTKWSLVGDDVEQFDAFGISIAVTGQRGTTTLAVDGSVGLTPGLCVAISQELVLRGEDAAIARCHEYAELLESVEMVSW